MRGSWDCAQDEQVSGVAASAMTAAQLTRHSARSEAQSQNPPQAKRHRVRGSCDFAQDDSERVDPATAHDDSECVDPGTAHRMNKCLAVAASAMSAAPLTRHSARSEAQSQNLRRRKRRLVRGSCDFAQDDRECVDPATSRGPGTAHRMHKSLPVAPSAMTAAPAHPSFCAERSAVAEPTPEAAPHRAWILRLRAG